MELLLILIIFAAFAALITSYAVKKENDVYALCDSPLERLYLRALIESLDMPYQDGLAFKGRYKGRKIVIEQQVSGLVPGRLFRADFLLTKKGIFGQKQVIVETDGAQFHNAEYDKRRDQCFMAAGYKTLRVKSKDAFSDPEGKAKYALDFLISL